MNKHEIKQMRKAWKKHEREIEELNNPKPAMHLDDLIANVTISTALIAAAMFLGWIGCHIIYQLMLALGLY